MGYSGKLGEKVKAQELRKRGLSYNEISKYVNVSKGTLSYWCRDVKLTSKQQNALFNRKLTGQKKGSVIAARNKQIRRWKEEKRLHQLGIREIGKLSKKQRFVAGVALYAAEGHKTGRSAVGFANSDPKMITFMMGWFREFGKVLEPKFRGAVWIHDNLDEFRARRFWSNLTGIPITQFNKSYIAENKVNSKKVRKQKHEYGIFTIRFSDVALKRRLDGWISGILG